VAPPPVPGACQSYQNDVAALEAQAQQLRADALAAVGPAAWTKLSQLGVTLLQLDRARAALQSCIDAHTGSLVCDLVLIDAGGGGTGDERQAALWDLSGDPVLLETAPVYEQSFAFSGAVPIGPVGVTVDGTDTATATGPDFRSGVIAALPPGSPRVEIVLGPLVTVTADDIRRWFAQITPLPAQRADVSGVGTVVVDLQTIAATLVPPGIRLTGVGTLTASFTAGGDVGSPLTATVTLGLVPSTAPDPLVPAELTLAAPPHVELAGAAAAFGAVLNTALVGFLGPWILDLMRPVIRDEISAAAARALSLVGLPPGATLSIRRLSIDPTAVTFQPALGAVGTVLSTYQPPAGNVVAP
jgi:hypothetical protein